MHRSPSSPVLVVLVVLVALVALAGCPGPGPGGPASKPPCPTDRTVILSTQDEVQALASCTRASGITIRGGVALDLAPLRGLEVITGDLVVGPTLALDGLALTELREVGGAIEILSNSLVYGVFVPRLERAGRISIEANAALTTVSLPRLETVLSSLVVTENPGLELVDLSALVTVGKDLVITNNPKLTLVEVAGLARVLDVRVEGNRALPSAQVEALRAKTPHE